MSDRNRITVVQAQPDTLERPSQVAERLGISTAMLRRHVAAYEKVFGDIYKDKRDGRLYTQEVSQRLEAAMTLYRAQRVPSVEEGLRRIAQGDESAVATLEAAHAEDPMSLLLDELRRLRIATERQNELLAQQGTRLDQLEVENRALREALPPAPPERPDEPEVPEQQRRSWWQVWRRP